MNIKNAIIFAMVSFIMFFAVQAQPVEAGIRNIAADAVYDLDGDGRYTDEDIELMIHEILSSNDSPYRGVDLVILTKCVREQPTQNELTSGPSKVSAVWMSELDPSKESDVWFLINSLANCEVVARTSSYDGETISLSLTYSDNTVLLLQDDAPFEVGGYYEEIAKFWDDNGKLFVIWSDKSAFHIRIQLSAAICAYDVSGYKPDKTSHHKIVKMLIESKEIYVHQRSNPVLIVANDEVTIELIFPGISMLHPENVEGIIEFKTSTGETYAVWYNSEKFGLERIA